MEVFVFVDAAGKFTASGVRPTNGKDGAIHYNPVGRKTPDMKRMIALVASHHEQAHEFKGVEKSVQTDYPVRALKGGKRYTECAQITMKKDCKFKTREQWLNAFVKGARPVFKRAGYELPANIRCTVGFTSSGQRGKAIGEVHDARASGDGHFEIFIKPSLGDASRQADVLTHELVHVAVGLDKKHGREFQVAMKAVGLGGKATATIATPEWHAWADPILMKIGPLPHSALEDVKVKKQSTRLIKCTCSTCGFVFRTTNKWIEETGEDLQCPDKSCCGDVEIS